MHIPVYEQNEEFRRKGLTGHLAVDVGELGNPGISLLIGVLGQVLILLDLPFQTILFLGNRKGDVCKLDGMGSLQLRKFPLVPIGQVLVAFLKLFFLGCAGMRRIKKNGAV